MSDPFTTVHQPFCSFLAAIGPHSKTDFTRAAAVLPRYRSDGHIFQTHSFQLIWFPPSNNPLHRWFLIHQGDMVLFLQGDFYGRIDEHRLRQPIADGRLDRHSLGQLLAELRGTPAGFVADLKSEQISAFTDFFGFNFVYHTRDGQANWVSSSLWPLLRLRPGAAPRMESIQETLLFGFPLGAHTLIEGLQIVQPARIVHLDGTQVTSERYTTAPLRRERSLTTALEEFRDVFRSHTAHVIEYIDRERIVVTLTGGHDTRVILNALLDNGITPTGITGSRGTLDADIRRSTQVARIAGTPFHIYNYARSDESLRSDSFFLSEGAATGLWMSKLSALSSSHGDIVYYGFSGDIISGSGTLTMEMLRGTDCLDSLVRRACMFNYTYKVDPAQLCHQLFDTTFDEVIERYAATFAPYRQLDPYAMYLFQRIDDRNFRRIGTFAHATQAHLPAVYLFHDPAITRLYLDLPEELLKGRRLHCLLSYYAQPPLAWIPANPWNVPLRFEPALLHHVRDLGRFVQRLHRQKQTRPARTDKSAVEALTAPKYAAPLALIADLGVVDPAALRTVLANEIMGGGGNQMALRIGSIAKMLRFARGETIADEEHTRLFTKMHLAEQVLV